MRKIALDIETTGLDPYQGHKIIEIGCVELSNNFPTGKIWQKYINPKRSMPQEAYEIHGLTEEFLSGVKEQMVKQDIPVSLNNDTSRQIKPTKRNNSNKLTSKNLKSLIKESVRELISEVVDERVQEAINMKTSSDENFQFKVGDRIFYGKITSSKSLK